MKSEIKTFAGVDFQVYDTSFIPVNTTGPVLGKVHSMDQMMRIIAEWINEAQDRQRSHTLEAFQDLTDKFVRETRREELV